LITFMSPGIAKSINIHVPFSMSRIVMSGLLLGIILSVRTCCFHNMITLPSLLVSTDLVHGHPSVCFLILPMFPCVCLVSLFIVYYYSMEQSPSWEANQSLQLVKKFPTFLWNPKVPYRTHKCPPPVPILSRLYPVPTPQSNLLEIHLNIIFPSMSGSPQWPLSLWFPHQHPVHTSVLPHTRHMTRPSHSSRFYHPHNIG
jgi:hypothetical protein